MDGPGKNGCDWLNDGVLPKTEDFTDDQLLFEKERIMSTFNLTRRGDHSLANAWALAAAALKESWEIKHRFKCKAASSIIGWFMPGAIQNRA